MKKKLDNLLFFSNKKNERIIINKGKTNLIPDEFATIPIAIA